MNMKIITNMVIVILTLTALNLYSSELNIFSSNNSPLNPHLLNHLCCDSTNKLWISNANEIYTYSDDGFEIVNDIIVNGGILDVNVGPKGDVWFVLDAFNNPPNVLSYENTKWNSYYISANISLPYNIYFNADSTVWFTLNNYWPHHMGGNSLVKFKNDTLTVFDPPYPIWFLSDFVFLNDTVYAIHSFGLCKFYLDKWEIIYPPDFEFYSEWENYDFYIIERCKNKVYIGGESLLLLKNNIFTNIVCVDTFLFENQANIISMHIQNENKIWLGTDNGYLLKYDTNSCEVIFNFGDHQINDIELDKKGNLWFTIHDLGLAVYNENNLVNVDYNYLNSSILNFNLSQNYPNPFNPKTTIQVTLPYPEKIKLTIYNHLGKEISTLANEYKQNGNYNFIFDGTKLSSGVYYYCLEYKNQLFTKKMLILK